MEETGVPGENHWPAASHWQTLSLNVVSSTPAALAGIEITTLVVIGTNYIGRCKSSYHGGLCISIFRYDMFYCWYLKGASFSHNSAGNLCLF